jgi:hypothetical protein
LRNNRPILGLGIGLVAVTAFAVAASAWLVVVPLTFATALVLGAIVAPPDAVTAVAVTQTRPAKAGDGDPDGESLRHHSGRCVRGQRRHPVASGRDAADPDPAPAHFAVLRYQSGDREEELKAERMCMRRPIGCSPISGPTRRQT